MTRLAESYVVQVVDGNGNMTLRSNGPRLGTKWVVRQVNVSVNPPSGSQAFVYRGMVLAGLHEIATVRGDGDSAGGDPPIEVFPGEYLTVQWTGLVPNTGGLTATARLLGDIVDI